MAAHLADVYGLSDSDDLLDDVFARAGALSGCATAASRRPRPLR